MTEYRVVCRHVGYWREAIHKWSTVYPLVGTINPSDYASVIAAMKTLEQGVNYPDPTTVQGGLYEIALYNQASGGVPVATATYFPEATPGSWVTYSGAGWATITSAREKVMEVALQVEWPAGLSKSGKPVIFRKWYHSVKLSASTGTTPDVVSADTTALTSFITSSMAAVAAFGAPLGNADRLAATTPRVLGAYGNHQMPRGRRKPKAKLTAAGNVQFPAGLLIVPGSDGSLSTS